VRLRILEGRRRTVEQQREGLRSSLARTRQRLDRYTLELQRHGLESVDGAFRWLSELSDSERREASEPESRRREASEPESARRELGGAAQPGPPDGTPPGTT